MVDHLFNAALSDAVDDDEVAWVFRRFSGAIMVVWPSVGGPWCNPAMMSLANILKDRGFRQIDKLHIR